MQQKVKGKVLFWDIESCGVNALKSDLGFCVMVGYKWNYEDKARIITIAKKDLKQFNDKNVLTAFSEVYNEADLTVAHFGSVFDRRFIQGRLLIHQLPPIPKTKMRDTCMLARSIANYSSNRLANLGNTLSLSNRKMEKGNGWPQWWLRGMQGDMKAIEDMAEYGKQDVLALEELYYRLLPFDNAHPRMSFEEDRQTCPKCGGNVQYHGVAFTGTQRYKRFQCNDCGAWGKDTKGVK